MALKITLKADERLLIGGGVLRNASGRNIDLVVENKVPLLREKEIIGEGRANTPCKKVYLVVQLMYIDPTNVAEYHASYWDLVKEIIAAAPSTRKSFETISELILKRDYYQALKETHKLIQYEEKLISHARNSK